MAAARASHERAEPTSARARSDSARPRLDPATLSRCPDRVRDGSSPAMILMTRPVALVHGKAIAARSDERDPLAQ